MSQCERCQIVESARKDLREIVRLARSANKRLPNPVKARDLWGELSHVRLVAENAIAAIDEDRALRKACREQEPVPCRHLRTDICGVNNIPCGAQDCPDPPVGRRDKETDPGPEERPEGVGGKGSPGDRKVPAGVEESPQGGGGKSGAPERKCVHAYKDSPEAVVCRCGHGLLGPRGMIGPGSLCGYSGGSERECSSFAVAVKENVPE